MAFDKRRTWKQVKDIEANAFDVASVAFHDRWMEHQDPNDLIRRDKLAVAGTRASISADKGPPPPPGTPSLIERLSQPGEDKEKSRKWQRRAEENGWANGWEERDARYEANGGMSPDAPPVPGRSRGDDGREL